MVGLEVATYLQAQSIGTMGTNLFYGILPGDPDTLVSVFEYGGEALEPNLGRGTGNLEFPRIQVVSRGAKDLYDAPRLVLQNVITALTAVVNTTLSGVSYKAIESLGPPSFRRDDNFRLIFSANFKVTKVYSV